MLYHKLEEKVDWLKSVASGYRGDELESDFNRGQHKALELILFHLEPMLKRESDIMIDDLFDSTNRYFISKS